MNCRTLGRTGGDPEDSLGTVDVKWMGEELVEIDVLASGPNQAQR